MTGKEFRPIDPKDHPSGFTTADEMSYTPRTREEELEDRVKELLREREEREADTQEIKVSVKPARPVVTQEEKLAFIASIHDLKITVGDLETSLAKKSKQIEDLEMYITGLGKLLNETTMRVRAIEDRRDDDSTSELRTELIDCLMDRHREGEVNGIYVKDLYNKKKKGKRVVLGKLNISKTTACRLKKACLRDPRLEVIQKNGKEVIRLRNIK